MLAMDIFEKLIETDPTPGELSRLGFTTEGDIWSILSQLELPVFLLSISLDSRLLIVQKVHFPHENLKALIPIRESLAYGPLV